jgi:dTDP-4-amino-4,6-dideoxygalactose transaminase
MSEMPYKVPFVNYRRQYLNIEKEIDGAIKDVMLSGDFILRQQLRDFESEMAAFTGAKYAIGLNSGTDALYLSLLAAGIGPGDEVITVAHTFLATVGAIVNCGAKPVLVDVGNDHNMDIEQVAKAVTARTRAVIPVHLNGRMCRMDRVMEIADKHKLAVIEDAAQSLGALYKGRKAGATGLTGCFSFYPAKILGTAGDGGMVVTSDKETADKIRAFRDNGRVMGQDEVTGYGFNSQLDNLHAAMLSVKMKYLPGWLERRRQIAGKYQDGLGKVPAIQLPPPPLKQGDFFDVYQNYAIRTAARDKLVSYLRENGVEVLISWPIPMNHQKALRLDHFKLPETEAISREVLSLPMYPELDDEQVEYVIQTVQNFFKGN